MPSGRIHLRIELFLLVLSTAGLVALRATARIDSASMVLFALSYAVSMMLLSPDLDLADSRATRRWGPLRVLWWPYAAIFKHRQISHHLLFGPLSRIVYFLALLLGIAFVTIAAAGRTLPAPALSGRLVGFVALGLYIPNVIHILADRVHTAWRRRHTR